MTGTIILMVEDNVNDEVLMLRALRKANIANPVDVARDGAEALDYLFARGSYAMRASAELPTIVFLDLNLPKISGIEVLRKIRADEKTRLLPVVVLTSSSEDEDVIASYRLGANSYVVKPIDFVAFAEAVKQLGLYWLGVNQRPPSTG